MNEDVMTESNNKPAITCICIDDEPFALAMIEEFCKRVPELTVLCSFTDAVAAIEFIKVHEPMLLFLDIQMPDITGLQIAKGVTHNPEIVFTTAYSEYAVDGFELDAVDYLLKPYSFDRFLVAFEKVKKRLHTDMSSSDVEHEALVLKSNYKNVTIYFSEIIYIEALDSYAIVYTKTGKITVHYQLKKLEELLPDQSFHRIHRSFIVNKREIKSFTKTSVDFSGKKIPVGRAYSESFLRFMGK